MATEKKYKLTDECITFDDRKLYRIEALKDFGWVRKGDKGGFIESEKNLSHNGDCWVFGDAVVYGNAEICNNAAVFGNARVWGNAAVFGNAAVCGNARVWGNAAGFGNAAVCGNAEVWGNAAVCGNAEVWGNAAVWGNAEVWGNAAVGGNAEVCGNAEVGGTAKVINNADYIVFKNWWSSGRYFTWTRSNNMWRVGCFYGTGEELIAKAYKDSELSGREYERVVKYVESIVKED